MPVGALVADRVGRPERMISPSQALGRSLIYGAPYFLPLLTSTQAYLLRPLNPLKVVVVPSLVTIVVVFSIIRVLSIMQTKLEPRVATGFAVVFFSALSAIALKGIAEAGGYHWQETIPRGRDLLTTQRWFRDFVFLVTFAIVWSQRNALPRLVRLLSSLGFAFGVLAVVRLVVVAVEHPAAPQTAAAAAISPLPGAWSEDKLSAVDATRPRRAVWVIFDEFDYDEAFGRERATQLDMPNFNKLAHQGVYATQAISPASATLYSIPALLTGVPIAGRGIRIDRNGVLSLEGLDHRLTPLNEGTSVFGVLEGRGQAASVLGFLHPYCQIFQLGRCDQMASPEVGTVSEALLANFPDSVSNRLLHLDAWSGITRDLLKLLPAYVARDDALTFLHLNVPHLTAHYADDLAHVVPSSDPLVEYSRNLVLADQILGEIVKSVEAQTPRHELLLVVSSDHWLRNRWYQANRPEVSRPIPLIMWKVGETRGAVLSQPLSTVHTSEMILDYLQGRITDQAQIEEWWQHRQVYPSFIAPDT